MFSTTGKLNRQLAATFVALPTFQRESIQTLNQLDQTAASANGLVTQLHGVAKEAGPTFAEAAKVAPELSELAQALGPLQQAGRTASRRPTACSVACSSSRRRCLRRSAS